MIPDQEETSTITPGRFLHAVYVTAGLVICLSIIAMSLSAIRVLMLNFIVGVVFSLSLVRSTQFLVQRFLTPGKRLKQRRVWLMVFLMVKFPVIMVFLALVAWSSWFDVRGFVIGVSLMPLLIVGYSLVSIYSGNSPIGQAGLMAFFEKQNPLENSVRR